MKRAQGICFSLLVLVKYFTVCSDHAAYDRYQSESLYFIMIFKTLLILQQICNNWFRAHNSLCSDVFRGLLGALQTSCKILNVLGAVSLIISAFGRVVGFYRKVAHQT